MGHVPRGTESAAQRLFGDRLPLAEAYAAWLVGAGLERGLLGPREADRIWPRHLLNSAVVAELVPAGARVCDVGSGAGLPGIPMAIARPDLDMVLLEPLLRRATFLSDVVEDVGLPTVRVVRGRAEEVTGGVQVDVAVARAVAPLDRLARWTLPLVRPGGVVLALKGDRAQDEVDEHGAAVRRSGAASLDVVEAGGSLLEVPTTVVRLVRAGRPAPRRTH